jgi:predicted nucleic acid-binding protein
MLPERGVINAGPLVAFSLMGRLELLPVLFREIWIPEPVYREVAIAGLGRPGGAALSDVRWAPHVCASPAPDPLLIAELDLGEAAVIALARSMMPCLAIIDEKRGRSLCRIAQRPERICA